MTCPDIEDLQQGGGQTRLSEHGMVGFWLGKGANAIGGFQDAVSWG